KNALIIGNLPLLDGSSLPISKYLYIPFLQERCEGCVVIYCKMTAYSPIRYAYFPILVPY
ncbi:MAG: hypothetical protein II670_03795, partial [Alphaproteobacteria bacterium]|nr:hypothetical protein [Alphaproteobacteria bacterium]